MTGEKGNDRHTAIILAAGRGSRMHSKVPKQYMELAGKPVLYYSLAAFEASFIDEIVLVTGAGEEEYCRREIVERFGFSKVTNVIPGGAERCLSVYEGLKEAEEADYVYIHDGARPFVDAGILEAARKCVLECKACAAGMPVKDTIKIADADGFVKQTPDRRFVWQIQTPQVFSYPLVREAYDRLLTGPKEYSVTDDAMVVELMLQHPVKLFAASYENIKITTPEDLQTAQAYLERGNQA